MDLTNLRESLDTTADQPDHALRQAYGERLNSEFRVAALQLTNLYKRGLENTHHAFQSGYALALRDTLDYLRGKGTTSSPIDLERYLAARLEALHQDTEDPAEARPVPTPPPRRAVRPTNDLAPPHLSGMQTPTRTSRFERNDTKPRMDDTKPLHPDLTSHRETPVESTPDSTPGARPRKRLREWERAMQYVGKLVSSVYNTITPNINPSTLNGAIDVIVVEREVETEEKVRHADGTETLERRHTTELAASPFHVRFGKLSVLRPNERKVTLHLNGSPEPLPFAMKVGENGEAFFVMKIDDTGEGVPKSLVTSPIVGPTPEPVAETNQDLEPLDLGASETVSPTEEPEQKDGSDADEFPAPFGSTIEHLTSTDLESAPSGGDEPLHASKQVVMDLLDMDGYKVTQNKQQIALAQGKRFASEMPLGKRHGGNGSLGYSERLDRLQPRWKRQLVAQATHQPSATEELTNDNPTRPSHARRASDTSLHLPEVAAATNAPERPHIPVSLSDSALSHSSRYMYEAPREDEGASSNTLLSSNEPHAVNTPPATEQEILGALVCADDDPYLFQLRMDSDTLYTFELSLCNVPSFDQSDDTDRHFLFDESRVSFQRFMEDASIATDARLCIRHEDRYHTRATEEEMFTTLNTYRTARLQDRGEAQEALKPSNSRSVWRRLWRPKEEPLASPEPPTKAATELGLPSTDTQEPPEEEQAASPPETYVKTLRLTSDQLKQLGLRKGANTITFSVTSSYSGVATCRARVFLWDRTHPVVVSDIDGTITKSDALGHVFTLMGRDWTHLGVAKLYHDIAKNGYRILYLTSRAIGQAEITREYLTNINQNNFRLPDGPVIMSPDRLMASLHREVILRKPEVFKMACLRDIARLFGDDPAKHGEASTPFYAGFGNRITDALSYRSVNIPSSRIFTIDSNGEVKMELLELAGYKSSYPNMTDLVDQMFPPTQVTHPRDAKSAAYTDFNYWRPALAEVELPPDEQLVPVVVQPNSPTMRALRSPRSSSRRSSSSLRSPTSPPADQERPGRFSRFGLSSLRLSRRKDRGEQHANTSPPPASPEFEPRSLDSQSALLPSSVLSTSPSDRVGEPNSIVYEDPVSFEGEASTNRPHDHDLNRQDDPGALHHHHDNDDDHDDDDDDDDDDDGRLSPEARRRRRRRGGRATSPGLPLFPSLYDRSERRKPHEPHPVPPKEAATPVGESGSPDPDEDPLLAAGDIQFEWPA